MVYCTGEILEYLLLDTLITVPGNRWRIIKWKKKIFLFRLKYTTTEMRKKSSQKGKPRNVLKFNSDKFFVKIEKQFKNCIITCWSLPSARLQSLLSSVIQTCSSSALWSNSGSQMLNVIQLNPWERLVYDGLRYPTLKWNQEWDFVKMEENIIP